MTRIQERIYSIASEFNVTVVRDTKYGSPNSGWACGGQIGLKIFDDPAIELVAFFHELGHIILSRDLKTVGRKYHLCALAMEGAAWEIGLNIAATYGYRFDFNGKEYKWAREQLSSYCDTSAKRSDNL